MITRARVWWQRATWEEAFRVVGSLALVAAVWLFIEIADEVREGEHLAFENQIMRVFRTGDPPRPIGPAWLADAARDITALGSVAVLSGIVAIAAGYLLLSRRRAAALFVVIASLGGLVVNSSLKHTFDRERPELSLRLIEIESFSFPSGHAMSSATVYLTLAVLLTRLAEQRRRKLYLLGIALLLILLVGFSRVFLGVHYPSDVLAGWAAGLAWAQLCWLAAHFVGRRRLAKQAPTDE